MGRFGLSLILLLFVFSAAFAAPQLIYSVNCGGPDVTDSVGIVYRKDTQMEGIVSDYGSRHAFFEVPQKDHPLYQTERYSMDSFSYRIKMPKADSLYTLVLRFAEVYFQEEGGKVFDVMVNSRSVLSNLDIYKEAGGTGRPFDYYFMFEVKDGQLLIDDVILDMENEIEITFAKGLADNPKCNAFALLRGHERDVPRPVRLQVPIPVKEEEEDAYPLPPRGSGMEDDEGWKASEKFASGPRAENPYDDQGLESLWPVFAALLCLVPVVFFLYKMK